MNAWFGDPARPWGRVCAELPHVPTPVGEVCFHCDEAVAQGDDGEVMPAGDAGRPIHRECLLRMVAGSVGHQLGTCRCYGGAEDDPPGMTRREAARAAAELFEQKLKGGLPK